MKNITRLFLFMLLILALPASVFAQTQDYTVHFKRDFGYGSGADVRGTFSLSVEGDLNAVQSVAYQIDDKEIANVTEAPFRFGLQTSSYPDGWHNLSAVVTTKDGQQVTTKAVRYHFLSNADQSQSMQKIFFPLLGGILVIMVIAFGSQFLMMRRNPERLAPGAARTYGMKGGTICPRCGRAYSIHFMSINLIGGCLDRCDFCGKVAFVRPRSRAELDAAVRAEAAAAQMSESSLPGMQAPQTEEERLKKIMDESKYTE